MAEPKTKPTAESVSAFLDKVSDKSRREDCLAVIDIMKDVTKEEPRQCGTALSASVRDAAASGFGGLRAFPEAI